MVDVTKAAKEADKAVDDWYKEINNFFEAYGNGHAALRAYWNSKGCQRCLWEFLTKTCKIHRYFYLDYVKNTFTTDPPNIVKDYQSALKAWNDSGTREDKTRFYCNKHKEWLYAGIGLYKASGGSSLGHVAWAYTMPTTLAKYYSASNDNTGSWFIGSFGADASAQAAGIPIVPPSSAHTEQVQIQDPVQYLQKENYLEWKPLMAGDGNYEEAYLLAMAVKDHIYSLAGNNCLDETYAILTGFGVENLPHILLSPTPEGYFKAVDKPSVILNKSSGSNNAPSTGIYKESTNPLNKNDGSIPDISELLSPLINVFAIQSADLKRQMATQGDTEQSNAVATNKTPDKFMNMMTAAIGNFLKRKGTIKVDNKDLLKNPDLIDPALQKLKQHPDKDFLKQIKDKINEAVKESDWREKMNSDPLQASKMSVRPKLSIDTKIGWAEVDYY